MKRLLITSIIITGFVSIGCDKLINQGARVDRVTVNPVSVKPPPEEVKDDCTLTASPQQLPLSGGETLLRLSVIGSKEVKKTIINNKYLESTVGGSLSLNITTAQTISGSVEFTDGTVKQCEVQLTISSSNLSPLVVDGVCRDNPTAADRAFLKSENDKLIEENAQIVKADYAKISEQEGIEAEHIELKKITTVIKLDLITAEAKEETEAASATGTTSDFCALLPETDKNDCKVINRNDLSDQNISYATLEVKGKKYLYVYFHDSSTFISGQQNITYAEHKEENKFIIFAHTPETTNLEKSIDIELCECTNENSQNANVAADTARSIPTYTLVRFEVSNDNTTIEKRVDFTSALKFIEFNEIEKDPPAGTKRAECPPISAT